MANKNEQTGRSSDRELIMTRIINAPRELVFKVWTEPEHIAKWWGPTGFTNTIHKMDVRPGGEWELTMHGPDGVDYRNLSIYDEVVRPERIVYSHITGPKFQMFADFVDKGGKTELTMRMIFESPDQLEHVIKVFNAKEGLKQNLDKLEEYMINFHQNDFIITRTFNAPRELVFKAWTEPRHIVQWWGPKGFRLGVMMLDIRPGGVFHYSMLSADGDEMWGRFVYHEIVAPERMVFVISFADKEGNIARAPFSDTWPMETMHKIEFFENEGKTKMVLRGWPLNGSDEERKTFEREFGNMQEGFGGTFDQLDTYLAQIYKQNILIKEVQY